MLKIIKILFISIFIINSLNLSFAQGDDKMQDIKVIVTEKIPGANCGEKNKEDGTYECTISPGFSSIQTMIGAMIKYFTALATLAGVLFIVINGIMLSMGGMDSGMKEAVKGRIIKTLGGLILLLLSGLILSMIAPWVYK